MLLFCSFQLGFKDNKSVEKTNKFKICICTASLGFKLLEKLGHIRDQKE